MTHTLQHCSTHAIDLVNACNAGIGVMLSRVLRGLCHLPKPCAEHVEPSHTLNARTAWGATSVTMDTHDGRDGRILAAPVNENTGQREVGRRRRGSRSCSARHRRNRNDNGCHSEQTRLLKVPICEVWPRFHRAGVPH